MSQPGYLTAVKRSGISTSLVGLSMSLIGPGETYQLDNWENLVFWSPDNGWLPRPFFYDNGVLVDPSFVSSFDTLFFIVEFSVPLTGPVTCDANMAPLEIIAEANAYNININPNLLVNTTYNSQGFQTKQLGLLDVAVGIERFASFTDYFMEAIQSREKVIIDILPGGSSSGEEIRGLFIAETDNFSGDVSSLETSSVSFLLASSFRPASDLSLVGSEYNTSTDIQWRLT